MHRLVTVALVLAIAGNAYAAPCRDKTTGKIIKCSAPAAAEMATPAASAATAARCVDAKGKSIKCDVKATEAKRDAMADAKSDAAADARADGMPSASKAPVCKVGKPCGKSCIPKDKVCHKS